MKKITMSKVHYTNGELTFDVALHYAMLGYKVAMASWLATGSYFVYVDPNDVPAALARSGGVSRRAEESDMLSDSFIRVESRLDFRTSRGSIQLGWTPSSQQLLSNTWYVFTDPNATFKVAS